MERAENETKYYKFHKFNMNLIKLLVENKLHAAHHKALNDPFDCWYDFDESIIEDALYTDKFRYRQFLTTAQWIEFDDWQKSLTLAFYIEKKYAAFFQDTENLTKYPKDSVINGILTNDKLKEKFKSKLTEYIPNRIISFSGKKILKNEFFRLMWAHYSDSYKGVMLEFDLNYDCHNEILNSIQPVKYLKERTTIKSFDELPNVFYEKDFFWDYENEFRIVTDKEFVSFDKQALKGITVGYNVSPSDEAFLKLLCRDLGYNLKFKSLFRNADGLQTSLHVN